MAARRARHYEEIRRRFRLVGPVRLFGFKLARLAPGRAILTLEAGPRHRHPHGVHGGVLATLADTALAMAIFTRFSSLVGLATVEMTINYLVPHWGGRLEAHARVLRLGKRLAVGEVEIRNARRELVAKSLLTYSIRPAEEKT